MHKSLAQKIRKKSSNTFRYESEDNLRWQVVLETLGKVDIREEHLYPQFSEELAIIFDPNQGGELYTHARVIVEFSAQHICKNDLAVSYPDTDEMIEAYIEGVTKSRRSEKQTSLEVLKVSGFFDWSLWEYIGYHMYRAYWISSCEPSGEGLSV